MKNKILNEIKKIEEEKGIKVVYLLESGSRAWNWESEDSDFDVRGVFIQDYANFIEEDKQIDKFVGDLDIVLWDLKKFFRLLIESNPSVWEWLSSDIIYLENKLFEELRLIYEKQFNKLKMQEHYRSMARQNFEKYINRNTKKANLKKYVYVLRSIACINFIEKEGLPPPKDYKEIINYLPGNIQKFFEKVVEDKRKSEDLEGSRDKIIDEYIISFWNKNTQKSEEKFDLEKLTILFKKIRSLSDEE